MIVEMPFNQVSGQVDQSAGMLDDSAKEKGYALMCVAEPLTDCRIKVIEEVRPQCCHQLQGRIESVDKYACVI
jgi:ferredoxin